MKWDHGTNKMKSHVSVERVKRRLEELLYTVLVDYVGLGTTTTKKAITVSTI